MKLKRKIISILMVIALVLSSIPLTLMPGGITAAAAPADPTLVLNRPTASIYVNEVTRVAYATNSLKPPVGNNSVIVKATKSGVPYLSGRFATIAYSGETPYATQISFTPGVTLENAPTISCNNTTVTYTSSTPAYANGTYTWTVSGGTAAVGTTLIFTVSYSYSETNQLSGKTYTNNYETQCVSYVESIAVPAGINTTKRTYAEYGFGQATKNRSYIATQILGENVYGSVYNNGTGNGSIDYTKTQAFTASASAWTTDFGVMKSFSDGTPSKNYNVAYNADSNRPLSVVYIDKSVTSTLASLNLRFHTVIPQYATDSDERVNVSIGKVFCADGIVKTFSSDNTENDPSTDTTVENALSITPSKNTIQMTNTAIGSTLQSYFEGVGPCKETGTKEYTVSLKYHTPAGWTAVYVGQSFSFRFITYDKGSLRTLIEEIHGTDPTTMSTEISEGEFKGYNPQSWYYSSGWEDFKNAYMNAKGCLAKPDVSQSDIDYAYSTLKTAYSNLKMRRADYSLADAYYKQATGKNSANYTLASWAKLQNLIDNYAADCSVLYQPAVDKAAIDIKAAIDALEYATADYSEFLANLNTVNKIMTETPTIYGKSAAEVYDGWSKLETVLKNSGCVYNELEGYTLTEFLDVTEQSKVEGYTLLLKNAIDALKVNGADYSAAKKAESAYKVLKLSYITDEVAENLTSSYNELVALHGLDLSHQSEIDAAVAKLNYWLDNIEYKPADISEAESLIAYANSIDRSKYSDFTAVDKAIASLESKLDLDIRYQSEIDRGVAALRSAIDKLMTNTADYTAVDEAIMQADAFADNILKTYATTYGFTAETFYSNWSNVTTAINNVVRNLDSDKQAQVDAYATAIINALSSLKENKADYSDVTKAQSEAAVYMESGSKLYTSESLTRLTNAYTGVVQNLDISKQAQVDGYAAAIRDAVAKLEYLPANYTNVNANKTLAQEKLDENDAFEKVHPGYSLYTEETVSALNLAIASVDTSLDIRYQSTVDGYAKAISDAIDALKYAPADYTQVELAKANIPEDTSLYTALSVATLNSVLKKIDTTLTADKQSTVDGYVTSINNAINGLKYKKADYSAVTAAKNKVPSDSSLYTEESWTHLQNKIAEVIEGLDIRYQSQVDTYAEAIETAIEVLRYKPADYTNVNLALADIPADLTIYTDASVENLNNVVNGIDKYLDIRYQTTVDGYADAVKDAIKALKEKGADYTSVTEAITAANAKKAEGIYTDESIKVLDDAIAAVVYNLGITEQERVNGFADAINDAISKLVEKFVPADYTQVDSEISKIPSDLTLYTDETVKALNDAVNAVDRSLGKNEQAKVDKFADNIKAAREGLRYKDADYSAVTVTKGKVPADSSIYTKESWQNLQNKLNAVVEGLDITHQTEVNGFAKNIEDAINALEYLPADYTEVEKAKGEIPTDLSIYTDESVAALNKVLDSMDLTLDIRYQSTVDTYPPAIREAIKGLSVKPADYSRVDAALEKVPESSAPYTDESWQNLQDKINAVVKGLDITHQAEVNKFADDIEEAIEELDPLGANYDDVRKAIQEAEAAMDEKLHTAASRAAVRLAINSVDYTLNIFEQAKVDGYAAAIRAAVEKLEYNPADYSAVTTAKNKVPTNSELYTDESWQNLQDALAAVEEGLDIRYQKRVTAFAQAIETALTDLKYKNASYDELRKAVTEAQAKIDTGLYTDETVNPLREIIRSINWEYDIRDQKKVDMYTAAVIAGSNALDYKPADYTSVENAISKANAKIEKGIYTDESVAALKEIIASVGYGYKIDKQQEVNAFAENIVKGTNDLIEKLANYTELQKILDLLDNSSSEIYNNTYKNFDEVMALINDYRENTVSKNMDRKISDQAFVNEMTATLQGYIDSLEPEDTKVAKFELKNGASYKKSGGVTYIKGLDTGLRENTLKSTYFEMENVNVTITKAVTGRYIGTGSTVTVTDLDGNVIGEYVILIYGDVNGDGTITARDINDIENQIMSVSSLTAAGILAANINGDRMVTAADGKLIENVISGSGVLNQSTGRVS